MREHYQEATKYIIPQALKDFCSEVLLESALSHWRGLAPPTLNTESAALFTKYGTSGNVFARFYIYFLFARFYIYRVSGNKSKKLMTLDVRTLLFLFLSG